MSRIVLGAIMVLMLFFSHTTEVDLLPPEEPVAMLDIYGFDQRAYRIDEQTIQRNQTLSDILGAYSVSPQIIHRLAEKARPIFDVRRLRAGKPLRIYQDDSLHTAQLVIYQPNAEQYIVFDLRDSLRVYEGRHPVTVTPKRVSGVITSSPYQTLEEQGANPVLAIELSKVFAWQIDFYRIQRGDRFEVIYEEREVAGQPVGLGKIIAARFYHAGKAFLAFHFGDDESGGYYDEQGNILRRAFLKAPLEYSRISSRYSRRRFHPVLKRYRPHLGTDYAAPTGTPIRATANGVVSAASYSKGNGRYVKIRHNETYTTGYLHMSKFAGGIRPGTRVRQGEVIGYVGSTGLATGPHLCYRFWMYDKQVDPLTLDFPAPEPIAASQRAAFFEVRDQLLPLLQPQDGPSVQVISLPGDPGTPETAQTDVTVP
ncbi:MAG: peptidoglycan DD-metalloendopeptidase family protein [Rhodothermales bacterium]